MALNLDEICREIEERENGKYTVENCAKLSWLYIIRDHLWKGNSHTAASSDTADHVYPVSSYSVSVSKTPVMPTWDMEHSPITQQAAMEWTSKMENVDGTKGPHWTMEQTKQVMAQNGIECDPLEFNIAINMMYSDYAAVAKKMGVDKTDFYAAMAKAFLDDPDAVPDKLSHYYEYVVK